MISSSRKSSKVSYVGIAFIAGIVLLAAVNGFEHSSDPAQTAQAAQIAQKAELAAKQAKQAQDEKDEEERLDRLNRLPANTPNGVPIDDKEHFFLFQKDRDVPDLLKTTDAAVNIAHANGLRCDTVSSLLSWAMSVGFTLRCNQFRYEYYLEDKGRGWEIRIAE
jgi:hypothetical protein